MKIKSFLMAFLLVASNPAKAGYVFADFLSFDPDVETSAGILNNINFTLTSTRAVAGLGNGGIISGEINGGNARFNSPAFTPALPLGDFIGLTGASDFRIAFSSPVTDINLHVSGLSSNRLAFTSGGSSIDFSLLSSDGDFSQVGSSFIRGNEPTPGDDANGSLFFAGTFSEISWTSDSNNAGDGFAVQLSVNASFVPEPSTALLFLSGLAAFFYFSPRNAVRCGNLS